MFKIDKLRLKSRYVEIISGSAIYDKINPRILSEYKFKEGDEIECTLFHSFLRDNDMANARENAFNSLAAKAKSEKELRTRLKERGHFPTSIDAAISAVKEYGYLDDKRLAKDYIAYRSQTKGSARIRLELKHKGVSEKDINDAFDESEVDDYATCKWAMEKLIDGDLSDPKYREKLAHKLVFRGFSYDVIKKTFAYFKADADFDDFHG